MFKEFCFAAQLSQSEAIGLVEALDRFDREGTDPSVWPEHIQDARSRAIQEAMLSTEEGRETLLKARAVFRQMEQENPDLVLVLRQVGADSDEGVIRALASIYRDG